MNNLIWGLLACAMGIAPSSDIQDWSRAEVTALTALNTPATEFLPSLSRNNSMLLFVSDRAAQVPAHTKGPNRDMVADNSLNVWCTTRLGDGSYGDILSYDSFNSPRVEDGSACAGIEKDVYIYASADTRESLGGCDLYIQTASQPSKGVVVVETKNIGSLVNSPYRDATPVVAPDGTLYFSSDRPGGMGGSDIWFCRYVRETGTWLQAENAGPAINTAGEELAPAMSSDGAYLIFTSDKQQPSFGGFDLFASAVTGPGKVEKPVNLGSTINSSDNEVGACVSAAGDMLYFSSDRTGSFDLYKASKSKK